MNRKSAFYWLIGIVIAAIAIAVAFHFDQAMQNFIAQHQNRLANKIMNKISHFGDWPEHFVVGLLLAGIAWWRGSRRWTRIFLSMLIALALAGLVARVVKIGTGRARPAAKLEQVWEGPRFSSKYHAFPSGHTAASTAFFGVLFFANWRIGLACLPIPILIAFSRMYVAAHYLSDIVCAATLGAICAAIVGWWLFRQIENRKSAIAN